MRQKKADSCRSKSAELSDEFLLVSLAVYCAALLLNEEQSLMLISLG